ncbi:MAG: L,D-transpeptidase [Proteobacteria bacterium]|nr:L,D-transpeptidase [Pseudomonadota bacterium]
MPIRNWIPPATIAAVLIVMAPARADVAIEIDKATQTMTVAVDGRLIWSWPVSTGKTGFDTPSGSFRTFRMEADHFSKEWDDAPMPHSIFFTRKGHAIHGSFDVKRLGAPASHGCVRLHPENAAKLFALVESHGVLKTTVELTGRIPPRGAPAVARRGPALPPDDAGSMFSNREFRGRDIYALPDDGGPPQFEDPPRAPAAYFRRFNEF